MKSIKRKLLSLLLAMAMVLTLVPSALADDEDGENPTTPTQSVTVAVSNGVTNGKATKGSTVEVTATLNGITAANNGYSWSITVDNGNSTTQTTNENKLSYNCPTAGSVSISVTVTDSNNKSVSSTTPATFTVEEATQSQANKLSVTPGTVELTVNGTTSTTVTASVKDSSGNGVSGQTVSVTPSSAANVAYTVKIGDSTSGQTDANGNVTISVTLNSNATVSTENTTYVTVSYAGKTETFGVRVKPAATSSVTSTLTATTPAVSGSTKVSNVTLSISAGTVTNVVFSCPTSGVTIQSPSQSLTGVTTASTNVSYAGTGTITVTATMYNSGTPVGTKEVTINFSTTGVDINLTTPSSNFNFNTNTFSGYGSYVTAYATVNGSNATSYYCVWSRSDYYNSYYYDNVIGLSDTTTYSTRVNAYNNGTAALTVKVYRDANHTNLVGEKTVTLYVGNTYGNYLASVNVTRSYNYSLSSTDDAGGASIVSQLSRVYNDYGYATPSYVEFRTTTSTYGNLNANTYTDYSLSSSSANYLGNVVFTPSSYSGRAEFSVRVHFNNVAANYIDGVICFDTTGNVSTGDINYSGTTGETVYFSASDFADLYYSKTSGGTLSYVTFSTVSSGTGTLYCNGSRLTGPAYYSATSAQNSLNSVCFTPSGSTASSGGTVRIGFTAFGSRYNYGYSGTVSGTVVITYLNGTAKDITYTPVGGSVNLNASDFTSVYRDVTGSTAPSDLTIQFQDVPTNGSLSYKSTGSSNPVSLRSTNVRSYRFSTSGSGTNQISNVTYTSNGTKSDSISYIAYSGSVARFTGKVVFNPNSASTTVLVTLTCPGSTGGAFNLTEFTKANGVVMANTTQVRFMMPSRGTLTYSGTTVGVNGVTVPVNMINYVYYRPNAGVNGVDTVAFICLDALGNQVGTGQVNVVISGNTSTSTSNGVTSINQFTDVPAGAWYYNSLNELVRRGIVQGTNKGKADPEGTLTYGQALKMILLGAGYPAQNEPAGNDWAVNYKTLAIQNNIVDSSVVLTAPISRDAVVEMAAKALKISPVSGDSPFTDSNNSYAIALYRTSPQIITGYTTGVFNGGGTLKRQELWTIVYNMLQYTSMLYSSQRPDGI